MANKPSYLDLRSKSADGTLAVPSPRLQHFAGDIPPTLSPLDAFAAQGRALAKQLDEEQKGGRRLSRLPHLSVAKSLSGPRPGCFRSASAEEQRSYIVGDSPVNRTEIEEPKIRPQSEHPRLSGMSSLRIQDEEDGKEYLRALDPNGDMFGSGYLAQPRDCFDIGFRAQKPEKMTDRPEKRLHDLLRDGSSKVQQDSSNTLNPTLDFGPLPQPRPACVESSEDDYTSSNAGSTFSHPRKLSSSSGVSIPHSPLSPFVPPFPRSPSVSSEMSVGALRLGRQTFNFSRPRSTASPRPSMDSPSKQQLSESHPSPSLSMNTPLTSAPSDENPVLEDQGPTSYTYAKYSLPRGRMLSRNSIVFSGLQTPHFQWEGPILNEDFLLSDTSPYQTPKLITVGRPVTPPSVKREGSTSNHSGSNVSPKSSPPQAKQSTSAQSESENLYGKFSFDIPAPPVPSSSEREVDASNSLHSDSTIRPRTSRTVKSVFDVSPEEHLTKAIECHEKGSLKESTYHLRVAAKQNNPTAMLLYALACRHGWGMRPDPAEGVQWLRKAVDCASLEVAEVEGEDSQLKPGDIIERKARRTQFALSIYELGVSHLNGWGIEQDKSLALRCFEIAGNWGDGDALAEAGFCYAQGVGCKKNLKKAAKFYRRAEAKGISMVGNSW
jgi:TPR repeat protein